MSSVDDTFPVSAMAVTVPIVSLLAMLVCIPPMVWHFSNRNLPACCLIGYIVISDLINIINALIWPTDNVDAWWNGAGLCDVEVKVMTAYQVGLPGALLCIFRSLAIVMDTDSAVLIPSRAQRLRKAVFEIFFCVGVPVLAMIMHFIVQGNRYFIFAISGCNPTYEQNWVSIVLLVLWPPLICLAAAAYGGLSCPFYREVGMMTDSTWS
jgi:pheromone a factor receptor